ncbi:sensor histidine kinase [Solwaraspora sp. WMMB335]|uniref:sensor histidine kinase n=1 Tax=Solwaraspora sp. WMMB335 TaxID=3404118 RepID=UPI003B936453
MPANLLTQRHREQLFDLALSGGIAFLAMFLSLFAAVSSYRGVVGLGHGLLMAAALLLRRRFPVATYAVIAWLAALQLLALDTFTLLPHDIAILIAMYSVVKYARQAWAGHLAFGVTLAGCLAASVLMGPALRGGDFSYLPGGLVDRTILGMTSSVAVGVWLAGLTVRIRRLYVLSLEERAATAERERDHLARIAVVEERGRIARELHDIVAHSLSVMIVHADGARFALDRDPERVRAALGTIGSTGREALGEMRQLIDVLRNPARSEPVVERPRGNLDQVGDAVEKARSAGLAVELRITGAAPEVPDGVALAVYRIVQESLTNTLRHAGARAQAVVDIGYLPAAIGISVVDDGGGRAPAAALTNVTPLPVAAAPLPTGGHGLVGMRERVGLYGGQFSAGPRLDGGWQVHARIPLALPAAA